MFDLNIRTLRELAGDLWFARGEAYFQEGRVSALRQHQGKLAASVRGTGNYDVALWVDGNRLQFLTSALASTC